MARALEVRAWPCDPSSDDYKHGPVIANNGVAGGGMTLSQGGSRVKADSVTWEHLAWRVAVDGNSGVLWVLCPDRNTVESYRAQLERLAVVVQQYGGLDNVKQELSRSSTKTLAPRMPTKTNAPKASDKRLALNGVTQAVQDALALGATMQDIRLAVYSAMGLDSDAA